jgi:hypothetical protein
MSLKGKMGRVEEGGELLQVVQDHQGWLLLKNNEGEELDKKVRKGEFIEDEDAEPFHEGEVFINAEGNAVDSEGNDIAEEGDDEEEEEDEDLDAKVMGALQRRKAEGAYEVVDLGDKRKSLCNPDWIPELRQFAGDAEGAMAYVEKELGLDEGFLAEKYVALNAGQKRMNAGNRLRSFRQKQTMLAGVGEELGLTVAEVAGLCARVGKGAITEKKIRAIHTADVAEANKEAEPEVATAD